MQSELLRAARPRFLTTRRTYIQAARRHYRPREFTPAFILPGRPAAQRACRARHRTRARKVRELAILLSGLDYFTCASGFGINTAAFRRRVAARRRRATMSFAVTGRGAGTPPPARRRRHHARCRHHHALAFYAATQSTSAAARVILSPA